MSRVLLDRIYPDWDNDPSNYRIFEDPDTQAIAVYYEPADMILEFFDGDDDKLQLILNYLIKNGVEVEEIPFGS